MTSIAKAMEERARLWITVRELEPEIEQLCRLTLQTLRGGGCVFFAGNGGSAADAQHLAAEYVGVGLAAVALTTDSSVLTALANDFGYDEVFTRQARALCSDGDLLVMHSTSGLSVNLIELADRVVEDETTIREERPLAGVRTAALLARDGGALKDRVDLALVVPTDSTQLAQEVHLAIGHIVFEEVCFALRLKAAAEVIWAGRSLEPLPLSFPDRPIVPRSDAEFRKGERP